MPFYYAIFNYSKLEHPTRRNVQKIPDNSILSFDNDYISVFDATNEFSPAHAKSALCATVNGHVVDMTYKMTSDSNISLYTFEDEIGKSAFWHSTSHILAQAVLRLFPETKLAIGPSIDNGFYYDFDTSSPITAGDLEKIQSEMKKIVKENLLIERIEFSRDKAIELMKENNQPYKVELINDLPLDSIISFYKQGEFLDLCAGPHIFSTGKIKAFRLTSIAGAYWRGSEKNKMLQRIYGVSFEKKSR